MVLVADTIVPSPRIVLDAQRHLSTKALLTGPVSNFLGKAFASLLRWPAASLGSVGWAGASQLRSKPRAASPELRGNAAAHRERSRGQAPAARDTSVGSSPSTA
jgi:hypothetical protein